MSKKTVQQLASSFNLFNAAQFAEALLKKTGMNSAKPKIKQELIEEIIQILSERVINVLVDSFTDREFFLFRKILEDHPNIDEIDAISVIAPSIPCINELLLKTVSDLFDELVEDAKYFKNK